MINILPNLRQQFTSEADALSQSSSAETNAYGYEPGIGGITTLVSQQPRVGSQVNIGDGQIVTLQASANY